MIQTSQNNHLVIIAYGFVQLEPNFAVSGIDSIGTSIRLKGLMLISSSWVRKRKTLHILWPSFVCLHFIDTHFRLSRV
jgi:hypothetical protein